MKITKTVKSIDGMAQKIVQETDDEYFVESTYVDYPNKHNVDVNSAITV